MSVKSGQAVTVLFATAHATTGAATNADALPVGTLYVNGTANAAVVTVANITVGVYKAALTLPALSAGDVVSLRVAGTVATVAGEGIVWQDVADTKRTSELNDLAAGAAMALTGDYDAAKTAAQAGDAMALTGDYDAAKTAATQVSVDALPDAGDVADAVWDELLAGHTDAGSAGKALSDAGGGSVVVNATVAISATQAAQVAAGTLAVRTYHSLAQSITSTATTAFDTATKLWLAVKLDATDVDAASIIFIEKTAGLTVLAGAAYTTIAHGSLTLGGTAGAWSLTVALDEAATALLSAYVGGSWPVEVKALIGADTYSYWEGRCDISAGIVHVYA